VQRNREVTVVHRRRYPVAISRGPGAGVRVKIADVDVKRASGGVGEAGTRQVGGETDASGEAGGSTCGDRGQGGIRVLIGTAKDSGPSVAGRDIGVAKIGAQGVAQGHAVAGRVENVLLNYVPPFLGVNCGGAEG